MKKGKIIFFGLLVFVFAGVYWGYTIYNRIFTPNNFQDAVFVNIPTGAGYNDVLNILIRNNIVKDKSSFDWLAKKMKYDKNIHPGRYKLIPGINNKELVTLLRSGKQTPVQLTFNNIRRPAELASVVSRTLETDSSSLMKLLTDNGYLKQFGFSSDNCIAMFIPNTYEFYWNTSPKKFMERMAKEYKAFWNSSRKDKATEAGLSQSEISILASIIEQETNRDSEKPSIAGVYMNRLKKGWKLEADPTLVFALGNFRVQRVLNEHKEIKSPYNTYMFAGLPPGPICMPSVSSIDAVLDYTKHDFMFFCARDDFSGYHSLARTYQEHLYNAKKFQKELTRRNIRS